MLKSYSLLADEIALGADDLMPLVFMCALVACMCLPSKH